MAAYKWEIQKMDTSQGNETQAQETQLQVTCPHCGKGFWHKVGHVLKSIGVGVAETAVDISLPPGAMGRD